MHMRTIRYYIDERAKQEPDKVYMIAPEPGLELTYGRLKEDSVNLGRHLMKLGISKGDKISFMLANGYQTAKIFLGAMYGGFVIAPLNLLAQGLAARVCAEPFGHQAGVFYRRPESASGGGRRNRGPGHHPDADRQRC